MSLNKVILLGNLGKNPEVKVINSDIKICSFSLATTERRKNNENVTEWHNVATFGKLAEICGKYLEKGQKVLVEGKIQTKKWQDDAGNTRYTTQIIANNIEFLSKNKNETSEKTEYDKSNKEDDLEFIPINSNVFKFDDDDEIPF